MSWAAAIAIEDAASVDALRLSPAVRAMICNDRLWLRGEVMTEAIELALRKAPGAGRFDLVEGDLLRPVGARVSRGRLPDGEWMPLSHVLQFGPQTAALPGQRSSPVTLRLVRRAIEQPANALLTTLETWTEWAALAPEVRLKRLTFAADCGGRVIVRGTPLPPLPGTPLVEDQGVTVPCGYAWEPAVSSATVRSLLGLTETSMALWMPEHPPEFIAADQFVCATRSAVRLTSAQMDQ